MADVEVISELVRSQRWRELSACRDVGSETFFADGPIGMLEETSAKAVCGECLVIDDCLAYAITHNAPFGVWGGMTAAERRVIRKTWLNTMAW